MIVAKSQSWTWLAWVGVLLPCVLQVPATFAADLYFPPRSDAWERVDPEHVGWDAAKLEEALDFAGQHHASGVVVLLNGRILAERHWSMENSATRREYTAPVSSPPIAAMPHAIEDVASVQKSVVSVLVGIAQERGLLKLDDKVTEYLGEGWSAAAAEQEQDITIRHLLTMTSGLSVRGGFDSPAGTKWAYNTQIYARTVDVLERASGLDRHELTRRWLTAPLGMDHSQWISRGSPKVRRANAFGFATTARDLARFGLLMLAEGSWSGTTVFRDQQYRRDATSSSQTLNPFYGYLWWVNRNRFDGTINPRLDTAPIDLIAANGAGNRHCYIVPSLNLVVTRIGDRADKGFATGFWRLLGEAAKS